MIYLNTPLKPSCQKHNDSGSLIQIYPFFKNGQNHMCYKSFQDAQSRILFSWLFFSQELAENPVYALVNVKHTGSLLQLYEEEGEEAVRQYCEVDIRKYLYNNGRDSSVIRHDGYSRWRDRNAGQTTVINYHLYFMVTLDKAIVPIGLKFKSKLGFTTW